MIYKSFKALAVLVLKISSHVAVECVLMWTRDVTTSMIVMTGLTRLTAADSAQIQPIRSSLFLHQVRMWTKLRSESVWFFHKLWTSGEVEFKGI